jgi:hypothetical protein
MSIVYLESDDGDMETCRCVDNPLLASPPSRQEWRQQASACLHVSTSTLGGNPGLEAASRLEVLSTPPSPLFVSKRQRLMMSSQLDIRATYFNRRCGDGLA